MGVVWWLIIDFYCACAIGGATKSRKIIIIVEYGKQHCLNNIYTFLLQKLQLYASMQSNEKCKLNIKFKYNSPIPIDQTFLNTYLFQSTS